MSTSVFFCFFFPQSKKKTAEPKFFKVSEWREWLEENHDKETEVFVGFWKKDSGKSGMAVDDAVIEALCFGWIDSTLRKVDESSYMLRFSPRRAKSNWTTRNISRAEMLIREGRMKPSGLSAFKARISKEKKRTRSKEGDEAEPSKKRPVP